jgi:hypothetical protein
MQKAWSVLLWTAVNVTERDDRSAFRRVVCSDVIKSFFYLLYSYSCIFFVFFFAGRVTFAMNGLSVFIQPEPCSWYVRGCRQMLSLVSFQKTYDNDRNLNLKLVNDRWEVVWGKFERTEVMIFFSCMYVYRLTHFPAFLYCSSFL